MSKKKIIFMGTAGFACPALEALANDPDFDPVLVVSQPDRRRARKVSPTPVKALALDLGLEVMSPESVNAPEVLDRFQSLDPDFLIVIAYGQLIGKKILEAFPDRIINIHGSLLPKYRGAAPIQRALLNGEEETGVTAMLVDQGMDSGDILSQAETEIQDQDDLDGLADRLAKMGAKLLLSTLDQFQTHYEDRKAQDHDQATYADKIKKSEAWLDFNQPAQDLVNHVRTLKDWPGAKFKVEGETYKVHQAHVAKKEDGKTGKPGLVLSVGPDSIQVETGEGVLAIDAIQAPSRKAMPVKDFLNGHDFPEGVRLGQ